MTQQLRGILTALPTPFAANGSIDESALRPWWTVRSTAVSTASW